MIRFQKLAPQAVVPTYQSRGASGFDFHALENAVIQNGKIALVRTGLAVEVPPGFELQIRARSGLAAKNGIFLVNGVGTVDCDYRGEVKIILSTCSDDFFEIKAGDRIAQGVIVPVVQAEILEVPELSLTERGAGGFGSTGVRPS